MVVPRRSALFMPASNARAIDKARSLPADVVIFDLEDAVAPPAKPGARKMAVDAARDGGYGLREVIIRVNGLDTAWGADDLAAVAGSRAGGVLLPKVEAPAAVTGALEALAAHGAPPSLGIWCMIETPRGVLGAEAIAGASPRVAALVMGTSDLSNELGARTTRNRQPMVVSLGLALLAARAHGRVILDGVHLDLDDDEGFAGACLQAREMGFDGKTLIHPKQIATANAAFSPSPEEIGRARRVIAAHAEAGLDGKGVAVLDGRLVENLHVAEAQRVLAVGRAIGALDPDEREP